MLARTPRPQDGPDVVDAVDEVVDTASLGSGTYYVPDVGIVMNGALFDGNDDAAVEAYHAAVASVDAPEVDAAPVADEPVVDPAPEDPDTGSVPAAQE